MPRSLRIDSAGVAFHVIQRGNNRGACFFGDIDRRFYLRCLAEAAARRGCAVHAYVLMSNHVHLLLTPSRDGSVSETLQDLGRKYVQTINRAHGRSGTLWEGRFRSSAIGDERYLMACHRYIEMNPVRAGIVEAPSAYRWTSHHHYASEIADPLLTAHHAYERLGKSAEERRRNFVALFADPVDQREVDELRIAAQKGWAVGPKEFLDRMASVLGRPLGPSRRGRPKKGDACPAPHQAENLF